jgi:hypothetical protein
VVAPPAWTAARAHRTSAIGIIMKECMNTSVLSPMAPAPDWLLLGTEPVRALFEYMQMRLMTAAQMPQGDGHPVVIFPGLAADRHSIGPLKQFAKSWATPPTIGVAGSTPGHKET